MVIMKTEEWKDVVGSGGRYQISTFGNVRSNGFIGKDGKFRKPRYMTVSINKSLGYAMFFTSIDGKKKAFYVHRMIAEAFIPNPDGKPEVNHIDGDKRNSVLWNLEWVTTKENVRHAINEGLSTPPRIGKGDDCPASKLTSFEVAKIKTILNTSKRSLASIARQFGVGASAISHIRDKRTWTHVEAA